MRAKRAENFLVLEGTTTFRGKILVLEGTTAQNGISTRGYDNFSEKNLVLEGTTARKIILVLEVRQRFEKKSTRGVLEKKNATTSWDSQRISILICWSKCVIL